MAISATLTVPSNIIANRPSTYMLSVSNSAGSDVTITSVQAVVIPSNNPGGKPTIAYNEPTYPPNRTKTVAAAGSLNVPMELVFMLPITPGLGAVMPGGAFLLDAVITVSDGSVCSVTNPQWVSISSGAPTPSQGYGQLRFDDGLNLINIALL